MSVTIWRPWLKKLGWANKKGRNKSPFQKFWNLHLCWQEDSVVKTPVQDIVDVDNKCFCLRSQAEAEGQQYAEEDYLLE